MEASLWVTMRLDSVAKQKEIIGSSFPSTICLLIDDRGMSELSICHHKDVATAQQKTNLDDVLYILNLATIF